MTMNCNTVDQDFSDDDDDDDDDDKDALSEFESRAQGQQFHNLGYLEAMEESKDQMLQEGFQDGYQNVFDVSVKIGELLAEATFDNCPQVVGVIKTFLEKMERSEERPSVTFVDLEELLAQAVAMRDEAKLT